MKPLCVVTENALHRTTIPFSNLSLGDDLPQYAYLHKFMYGKHYSRHAKFGFVKIFVNLFWQFHVLSINVFIAFFVMTSETLLITLMASKKSVDHLKVGSESYLFPRCFSSF